MKCLDGMWDNVGVSCRMICGREESLLFFCVFFFIKLIKQLVAGLCDEGVISYQVLESLESHYKDDD